MTDRLETDRPAGGVRSTVEHAAEQDPRTHRFDPLDALASAPAAHILDHRDHSTVLIQLRGVSRRSEEGPSRDAGPADHAIPADLDMRSPASSGSTVNRPV